MAAFIAEHAGCFKTKSPNSHELASRHVGGLPSQTQRKNMERMDERLGADEALCADTYQATQQFISSSPWDTGPLYPRVIRRLGATTQSAQSIDESANAKKGAASVGVARQWNGRLGKARSTTPASSSWRRATTALSSPASRWTPFTAVTAPCGDCWRLLLRRAHSEKIPADFSRSLRISGCIA
ncbi:MAG: transposase [Prosthecobacter sp.]|nr:transposase [Prosthecobacter sp.]